MKETICKDRSEIFNLARHSQRRRKARGGTSSKKGRKGSVIDGAGGARREKARGRGRGG